MRILIFRGLTILKGAVPDLARGLGHTAPTYIIGSQGSSVVPRPWRRFVICRIVCVLYNKNQAEVAEAKSQLRKTAASRRAELGLADRVADSARATAHFLSQNYVIPGAKIALYWPMGNELDCRDLIDSLRNIDALVCLPAIIGTAQPLVFREFTGEEDLVSAGFGTREPSMTAPIIVPDIITLPLLAFDNKGNRLGYGGGFYDRTIASMTNKPLLVGLAFEAQLHDFVPTDHHDKGLDMIVTDTGARRFR